MKAISIIGSCYVRAVIITFSIFVIYNPAFSQERKSSREARGESSYLIIGRAPTVAFITRHAPDEYPELIETGVSVAKLMSEDFAALGTVQYGSAVHIGTSEGWGRAGHLLGGLKWFVTNSIYFDLGMGFRYINAGLIEDKLQNVDQDKDYGYEYKYEETARITTVSFGTGAGFGWLWQHNKFTVGFELGHIFAPMFPILATGSAYEGYSDAEAKRIARRLSGNIDYSLPRFLIGFAF